MMPGPYEDEEVVGVTEFKVRCLGLVDAVTSGKLSRVVLTKRGKRIAIVTALSEPSSELWGCMRGTVTVAEGVDLTQPTGDVWEADA